MHPPLPTDTCTHNINININIIINTRQTRPTHSPISRALIFPATNTDTHAALYRSLYAPRPPLSALYTLDATSGADTD